ncbi:MAG TPA: PKD domain-containing protein [Nitrospiraceae bacterium]|nr:PKD domain-containing protein [Nitrospiraceae bacterium]
MLTGDRTPAGNMSWAVLFFFAATLGFNGCGDGNNAPPASSDGVASTTPVANAGPDQGGKAPGSLITLNGSASSDANGAPLTYSWSLSGPAGSAAVLANPTSVSPTFTVDLVGTYTAQLIVNNGTVSSAPDTVIITNVTTFRSTLASDNFNRADNADAGSAWDAGYTDKNPMAIVSQQVRPIATNPADPKSAESYHAVTPGDDQWCQITLGIWTGSEDREFGCTLRTHAPPTVDWYWCYARANGSSNASIVSHHTGGVGDINLASDFSVIWAAGDKLRCEAQGTALRLYRIPAGTTAETLLLSTTDDERTSGRAGLLLWMETGGDLSHAAADDFAMGELAAFDTATGATTTITSVDPTRISATDFRTKATP